MLQSPLCHPGNKRALPLVQILVFIENIPQYKMAVGSFFRHLHQDCQNDLSFIHRFSHCFSVLL